MHYLVVLLYSLLQKVEVINVPGIMSVSICD